MDRNSKIFAQTISVGGVRKPAKKVAAVEPANKAFDSLLCSIKKDLTPTILNNFSYKSGDNIVNFDNARVRSITKNKKHVGFLVNGDSKVIDHKEAMKGLSNQVEQ
jgi:hypothetical protein